MNLHIDVKMVRGGYINTEVDGNILYEDGSCGYPGYAVDWLEVYWPGGGVMDPKHYDENQVAEAFIEACKEYAADSKAEAMIDRYEAQMYDY